MTKQADLTPALFERYLGLLGQPAAPPSLDALTDLVAAHMKRIPFENVSKLLYRKHSTNRGYIPLSEFLDGIELYNFGGTCYSNNFYMNRLLRFLGYDAKLCAADIAVEGAPPNGHMYSLVTLNGRGYIVDVGYGAPFMEPLPRDGAEDVVVELGHERYVLKPANGDGISHLQQHENGAIVHGYRAKPEPREPDFFAPVIARSLSAQAPFMRSFRAVQFEPGYALSVRNLTLTEMKGRESTTRQLADRKELVETMVKRFGMPRDRVEEAVAELGADSNLPL